MRGVHCLKFTITGVVIARKVRDANVATEHVMLPQIPDGMPALIQPDGLSLARRKYLAKEIREFCDEEVRDLVCPLVEGRICVNSKH